MQITIATINDEIHSVKKLIRRDHKGRVYFDEPTIDVTAAGNVRLSVNFRVADNLGGFVTVAGNPEQSYLVAL